MFRFSIREILMATLVVAIALGWWASEKEHAARFKQFETDTKYAYRWRACAEVLEQLLKDDGWTLKWDMDYVRLDAEWSEKTAPKRPVFQSVSTSVP